MARVGRGRLSTVFRVSRPAGGETESLAVLPKVIPTTVVVVGLFPWADNRLATPMKHMARVLAGWENVQVFYLDTEWPAPPGTRWHHVATRRTLAQIWRIRPAGEGLVPFAFQNVAGTPASPETLYEAMESGRVVVWANSFWSEQSWHIAETFWPDRLLYECHENVVAPTMGSTPGHTALLARADAVVAITEMVADHVRSHGATPVVLGNGVELDRFRDAGPAAPTWTFGFVGHFYEWLDVEALAALAEAFPEESLVLVGPVQDKMVADVERLKAYPNVHVRPAISYAEVPALLQSIEVCLLPRLLTPESVACDPLKLYEYLAAGRPVVSTALPAAVQAASVVYVAKPGADFVEACRLALAEARSGYFAGARVARGRQLVAGRTWEARAGAAWAALAWDDLPR